MLNETTNPEATEAATAADAEPAPKPRAPTPDVLIQWAGVDYAWRGVIPVRPDTKRPFISDWQSTCDVSQATLVLWWKEWPHAQLGLVTGLAHKLWMLDVDFRSGGRESLAALEAKYGPLPRTCVFRTPNGLRFVFRWELGVYLRTVASKIGRGLDVRGHRADGSGTGQSLVPPSVTASGAYDWEKGCCIETAERAPLWLLFLVAFRPSERAALAALGIDGPEGFGDAEPAQWQALYLEKVQAVRGPLMSRNPRVPGEAPILHMPETPLTDQEKVRFLAYITAGINGKCADMAAAPNGRQEIELNNAGLRINSLLLGAKYLGIDVAQLEAEAFQKYVAACVAMACHKHGEPWTADDALRKWEHTAADADPAELLSKIRKDRTAEFSEIPRDGAGAAPPIDAPRLIRVSDFANREKKPRAWHIPGLVPAGQPTLLFGDGATGKSLFAAQTTVATVLRQRLFGHEITNPGPALYIGCEDDEDEMHRRFDDIAEQSGAKLADLRDLHLYCLAGHDAVLGAVDRNEIVQPTKLWGLVYQMIMDLKPACLVLDTLADLFAGNENSRTQARQFIGMIRRPTIQLKAATMLLAHPSLSGMASGTGTSGSTGWSNSVRSRLYLTRPTAGADQAVVDPDVRSLHLMKANYVGIGDEIKMRWQNGVFVPDVGKPAAAVQADEKRVEDVFLGLLRAYISDGRNVSQSRCATYAPNVFERDPRACGYKRKHFEGAMNRLFAAKRIRNDVAGPKSKERQRIVPT